MLERASSRPDPDEIPMNTIRASTSGSAVRATIRSRWRSSNQSAMSMRRVGIFLVSRRRSCLSRRMEEAAHADGDRDHREQQRPTFWRKAFDRFLRDPLWIDELRRYDAGDKSEKRRDGKECVSTGRT